MQSPKGAGKFFICNNKVLIFQIAEMCFFFGGLYS